MDVDRQSCFILLHVPFQFSQNHVLKSLTFLTCIYLTPFKKLFDHINGGKALKKIYYMKGSLKPAAKQELCVLRTLELRMIPVFPGLRRSLRTTCGCGSDAEERQWHSLSCKDIPKGPCASRGLLGEQGARARCPSASDLCS
mgnify:CR=1 FL=1